MGKGAVNQRRVLFSRPSTQKAVEDRVSSALACPELVNLGDELGDPLPGLDCGKNSIGSGAEMSRSFPSHQPLGLGLERGTRIAVRGFWHEVTRNSSKLHEVLEVTKRLKLVRTWWNSDTCTAGAEPYPQP
jgi:hypothetical protein